ncbi:AAA+ family ATPase [Perkinsela sp. CCAP 1560/4]|nr:AAA+ family ATPase [Perkinsela sp. CCAP 1560/4]|eukprot:KNH07694.1 AAA+ family ATPase [Perkinsela sp. CCAP 1560/4]
MQRYCTLHLSKFRCCGTDGLSEELTQFIRKILSLVQQCNDTPRKPVSMNNSERKRNIMKYLSHHNAIASSYTTLTAVPKEIATTNQLKEEIQSSCAAITPEHLKIADSRQLVELATVIPTVALWSARRSMLAEYNTSSMQIHVTLLQEVLALLGSNGSTGASSKEISFQGCAKMLQFATLGLYHNESLYHMKNLHDSRLSAHSAFMYYYTMSPETLYGFLLQAPELFMNIHGTVLRETFHEMADCANALRRSKISETHAKSIVRKYQSLHPKKFRAALELAIDGLFLLDRHADKMAGSNYEETLHSILQLTLSTKSVTITLLSIYPNQDVCRLICVLLYIPTRLRGTPDPPLFEEVIYVLHATMRGFEGRHLYELIRSCSYFEAFLQSRQQSSLDQLKSKVFILLISLGEEAGRRVEEIPKELRPRIISIFQSLRNQHTMVSCAGLERVLSSLTQW